MMRLPLDPRLETLCCHVASDRAGLHAGNFNGSAQARPARCGDIEYQPPLDAYDMQVERDRHLRGLMVEAFKIREDTEEGETQALVSQGVSRPLRPPRAAARRLRRLARSAIACRRRHHEAQDSRHAVGEAVSRPRAGVDCGLAVAGRGRK